MKTGRSLADIAAELERQRETRRDYIAPNEKIRTAVDKDTGALQIQVNGDSLPLTDHAHGQLATSLDIPRKYYDRMRTEAPDLLERNVRQWLDKEPSERRMVRTLDNRVRALLSPTYRPLDNYDLATVVLPTLQQRGAQVMSAELTETRLYIKAILPELSDAPPEGMTWGAEHRSVGDPRIVAAIVVRNSEVGAGAVGIEPSVFSTWCTNLAIQAEAAMRKYHVGRGFQADENLEAFRDETRAADDRAFWLKVRDITRAAFSLEGFQAAIAQIRKAAGQPISSNDLPAVVEVTRKRLALPDSTQDDILAHLARGGDLSAWGLSSAITRAANDQADYETATALERAGGRILTLPASDWKAVATATA